MDQWLTTDESAVINFWDLETEVLYFKIIIIDYMLINKKP